MSSRAIRLTKLSGLDVKEYPSKNGRPIYYEFVACNTTVFSTYGYKKAIAFAKGVGLGRSLVKIERVSYDS